MGAIAAIAGSAWGFLKPFLPYILGAILVIVCWELITGDGCARRNARSAARHRTSGEVASIVSGAQFTIRAGLRGRNEQTVSLEGIEVPASGQPWAEESQANLARLIDGKTVRIEIIEGRKLGRGDLVGVVYTPDNACANLAQLRAGLARVTDREREDWVAAEAAAQQAGRGLWKSQDNNEGDHDRRKFPFWR